MADVLAMSSEMGRRGVYPLCFSKECGSRVESGDWENTENGSVQAVEEVGDAGVRVSKLS